MTVVVLFVTTPLLKMKPWQFFITTGLGVAGLILAIALIIQGNANGDVQFQLQQQQVEINKGSMSQQVGVNLLKEMAQVAVNDNDMKDLLKNNGFTLTTTGNTTGH